MDKKKNTYMLTVIAIATLLVAVVGATYAYFTASVSQSGDNSTSATAAKLSSLNMDVSELRKIDKGIYPGWVGYQKITITAPDGTQDGAVAKYNLTMKSTNGFDTSDSNNYPIDMSIDKNVSASVNNLVQYSNKNTNGVNPYNLEMANPDNLTYVVYKCTEDKVCTSLEEDDIYNQGELKIEDILDDDSLPTGIKAYYFDGAEFNIDSSITDYKAIQSKTLPNTGSNSSNISKEVTLKKGNVHVYYIVYSLYNGNYEQDDLQGATFTTEFNVELSDINPKSLYDEIAKNSLGTDTSHGIKYVEISSNTNGKGIYTLASTASDTYPVYFYRGDVTNNHVLFNNICWRIVRTTSTGGVKLIYDGLPNSDNECNNMGDATQLENEIEFNELSNKPEYVGWKYTNGEYHGTSSPSTIYGVVKDWYDNNMISVQTKLESTTWCSDRRAYSSFESVPGIDNEMSYDESSIVYYAPILRTINYTPSLECLIINDQFPGYFGLITSDEVMYAGGAGGVANISYYLNTGNVYWTMSPMIGMGGAVVLSVDDDGALADVVSNQYGVRPVVSLNSSVAILSGDGSSETPYILN